MKAKYKMGDVVQVNHRTAGPWVGEIVYVGNPGDAWEYAVTNSPWERDDEIELPEWKYHPLAWESEIVGVVK